MHNKTPSVTCKPRSRPLSAIRKWKGSEWLLLKWISHFSWNKLKLCTLLKESFRIVPAIFLYFPFVLVLSDLYHSPVIEPSSIHFRDKQNTAGALKGQLPDTNPSVQLQTPELPPAPEHSCAHQGLALTCGKHLLASAGSVSIVCVCNHTMWAPSRSEGGS